MTEDEIKTLIVAKLAEVAPELEGEPVDPQESFHDQFDFDSMDFLNLVIAVHEALGIDIPERDYPRLSNLDGWIRYLGEQPGLSAPR